MAMIKGAKNTTVGDSGFLSGKDVLWSPTKSGPNYMVVLDAVDEESLTDLWCSTFQANGQPLNASWLYSGPEDPANVLGLKTEKYFWVWVGVLEGSTIVPKLYAMPDKRFAMLKGFEADYELLGLVVRVQKERFWTLNPGKAANLKAPAGADNFHIEDSLLQSLRAQRITDVAKITAMLSPVDANGDPEAEAIWKMLCRRAEKANDGKPVSKAEIVRMYGKNPADFGIADEGLTDF